MTDMQGAFEQLCTRLLAGEVAALARVISLVEAESEAGQRIYEALRPHAGKADVVGITGPPGAGKSTLIDVLVSELRAQNKRVAVVAVDPSSPITGGAVLGDRTRMGRHTDDPGVYIRSVSARGHLGGLSASVPRIVDLVDVAGWDVIVLETVGAGQSETEVAEVADIRVVVNAPGLGDEVQAIKAGILEIADILVVNKADAPLASTTVRQLQGMLQLRDAAAQQVPVISTVATEPSGIPELLEAIEQCAQNKFADDRVQRQLNRTRRLLAVECAERARHAVLEDRSEQTEALLLAVVEGRTELSHAVRQLQRGWYSKHEK